MNGNAAILAAALLLPSPQSITECMCAAPLPCQKYWMAVHVNGRITGRIVDVSGNPVKGARVAVLPAWFISKAEHSKVSVVWETTDAAGRYDIGPLPAEEYHVGVNIDQPPTLQLPYPPIYFPVNQG